jgi:uncharacterized protein (DUF2147 family)
MKKITFLLALSLMLTQAIIAQTGIAGVWKTIDDETDEAKSHVQIVEKDGKYYGSVVEILTDRKDAICTQCDDHRKDQPVLGMTILENLEVYKDYYSYGKILDPNNGKIYKCSAWLEKADELTVRGYVGISALGRSQKWYRVKN